MDAIRESILSTAFLFAILRLTTPILLPSLGALVSSKAGVINVGLEGIMLTAAFTSVVVGSIALQNPQLASISAWIGLLAGVASGVLMALLLAFFHLELKGDLILGGLAINILGSAGTIAIMFQLTGDRSSTSKLVSPVMPVIDLPFLKSIPLLGDFLYGFISNQNVMTWIAFGSVAALWFFLYRTPTGRHLRAVGENPDAAASVGISVKRTRYLALGMSGMFAALGGIHLSMGYLTVFTRDMAAGRGFIALATPALGNYTPLGTMIASLFFGAADALGIRLGTLHIPSELTQMIPYIATILALVISSVSKQRAAAARARKFRESQQTATVA